MAKVTVTGVVVRVSHQRGWWGPYRHIEFYPDTDKEKGCWFSDNGVGWLEFGNRGTITGYTSERHEYNRLIRPRFEEDTTPIPAIFRSIEGTSLIKDAHKHSENPVPRLVIADWLSDQGDPVNMALAEVIRSSIESRNFKLVPWERRGDAAPFTGAWNGWLIGRNPNGKDGKASKWLEYQDYREAYLKAKKKRR
jgi:uncharacterized protein (TIGR02996 family)